ncbi:MAG: phosphodiester glycosidase family protein [Actinomycetota bacterium]
MAGGRATRATPAAAVAGLAVVVAVALARLLAAVAGEDQATVARAMTEPAARLTVSGGSSIETPDLWARARLAPAAPSGLAGPVETGCQTVDHGAGESRLRSQVVARAYCDLLGRTPDVDGATYWSDQLADGLAPAELVVQLAASPEYRAARPHRQAPGWTPFAALVALDPSPPVASPSQPTRPLDVDARTASAFTEWVGERAPADATAITPSLVHGEIVADGQRVNVAWVHRSATAPPRVSPGDRGRATVGTWAAEIGADVAINGNWYAPWDGPAVAGGRVYGGSDHGYTALFGFTADGEVIVEHHREINDAVDPRIVEGISGHPTLIHRGERTTDFGGDPTFLNRHPRTAIGLDVSGDVLILVTVDGRRRDARGMTGDETAVLLEELGASEAVMLDGGGSTTMWIAGRGVVNRPSDGSPRAVGNQLAVFGS